METKLLSKRKSIRIEKFDYSQNGLYFITICTKSREFVFGEIINGKMILSENGEIARVCWNEIPQHFSQALLHEFVIMPDHVHGIIEINTAPVGANHHLPVNHNLPVNYNVQRGTSQTIGSIVRGFKIGVTKQIGFSPWQRNYYEHIIRSELEYLRITNYIIENPLKWNGRGES